MGKITYFKKWKVGREWHNFAFEHDNFHGVILESKKLSFPNIEKCDLCGSDDLDLSAHTTEKEGYDYVYIRCRKCRATLNFGQQKKDKDMFYLRMVEIQDGPYKGQKAWDWKAYVQQQQ